MQGKENVGSVIGPIGLIRLIGPILLDLSLFAFARAIAKDREHNHHQQRDEDYDNCDFHCRKQEAQQQDDLFEQRHHDKDQRDYCSESTKSFKNATTHKFNPVEKVLGSPFEWKRSNVAPRELCSFTGAKSSRINRPCARDN